MGFKIEEVPEKEVSITENSDILFTYCYGESESEPFFHPLYAPNEQIITEDIAEDKLPGLCFSLGTVYDRNDDEIQLKRNTTILKCEITRTDSSEEFLELILNTKWKGSDTEIVEKSKTTAYSSKNDVRILDINIVLQTHSQPITFSGDIGLSYFAVEMEHRKAANSDGRIGESEVNQQSSKWVTLCGISANTTVGLAIIPHPTNGKTFFQAEDMYQGYLLAQTPQFTLDTNAERTLKYRVVIYVGDLFTIDLSEYYENYISECGLR